MNLKRKKLLAARTLKVGNERIVFMKPRIDEIKEAITKQDIRDLYREGAIKIKEVKGRKKVARKKRRGPGRVKKKVSTRKQDYVKMTRKLRVYVSGLYKQCKISKETLKDVRKKIRNKFFRSKENIKDFLGVK